MKKAIFLLLFISSIPAFCQENKLSGIYTEYKRTLWNNEDGSKYTINQKPFECSLQFDFREAEVVTYDHGTKIDQSYVIKGDTLILEMKLGKEPNIRKVYTKYIILEKKGDLVLREFKDNLDDSYYLRKFFFKKSNTLEQEKLIKRNYDIYTIVEESPSYPGGVNEMKKFIGEEVAKSSLRGTEKVFLKLLISPEGKIINIDVLNSPKVEYVEEAIRITKKFPDFIPGKQNGKPVYVYYNFPVKFSL